MPRIKIYHNIKLKQDEIKHKAIPAENLLKQIDCKAAPNQMSVIKLIYHNIRLWIQSWINHSFNSRCGSRIINYCLVNYPSECYRYVLIYNTLFLFEDRLLFLERLLSYHSPLFYKMHNIFVIWLIMEPYNNRYHNNRRFIIIKTIVFLLYS